MRRASHVEAPDVVLIGGGIMSANLGALLKLLGPRLRIQVYEAMEEPARESSHAWNNAGTGHAGLCELSYTPDRAADGPVNIHKAVDVFSQFEHSLQFWSQAVATAMIERPGEFISPVPHVSFVQGEEQVDFLRARHLAMSAHHFFRETEFTTDRATIGRWAPLLTERRDDGPIAATKADDGTDVNFGAIATKLLGWLARQERCGLACRHRVIGLEKTSAGWNLQVENVATGEIRQTTARFVFLGAGGASLQLLQKTDLPEARGVGGFPIGGQWLVCDDPAIVRRHRAKVYGQALGTAPTMAVPHLDCRVIDGTAALLFGPFAAWTTKFLRHQGKWTDLPRSVKAHNVATLFRTGCANVDLIKYLIQQGLQSMDDRMATLRLFYPAARPEDWRLVDAGIRVQAIRKTDGEAGIVHYGTEVLTSDDRSLAALLGASPGASVSVDVALEVVKTCFSDLLTGARGKTRIEQMVPSYEEDLRLSTSAGRFRELHARAQRWLQLK